MRLVIDPGHGGSQPGIARGELIEKHANLSLATQLALSMHGTPVAPTLTRYDDTRVSLEARGEMSSAEGADLVLAIHVNGHSTATHLHGAECYIWPGDAIARQVAGVILQAMPDELRTRRIREATDLRGPDDDWLQRPRSVLAPHVTRGVRALLVECGYATNDLDREYLLTWWGRAAVVCALRAGVIEAARLLESTP